MAVCQTIRTRTGIVEFLLNSENGDEYSTAFKYSDNKVEVHSLKKECAPLYLEENTSVDILSVETYGALLLAVTPVITSSCLDIRLWDISSPLGFTPREVHIKIESKKDTKFRGSYSIKNAFNEDLVGHLATSIGSLLSLIVNGKFCVLMKARKNESGAVLFEVKASFTLNDLQPVVDAMFLSHQHKNYLVLAEGCNVNILSVDKDSLDSCNVLSVSMKKSRTSAIKKFHKLTPSKCLVIDDLGRLSLLSVPNEIVPLKLPGSVGGHSICAVVGFKHTSEGILAICNNDYTTNLYSLADILTSVNSETSMYVKPYRILCNQFPINSLTFVKSDQLAMASSVNQSITFWGGFTSNV